MCCSSPPSLCAPRGQDAVCGRPVVQRNIYHAITKRLRKGYDKETNNLRKGYEKVTTSLRKGDAKLCIGSVLRSPRSRCSLWATSRTTTGSRPLYCVMLCCSVLQYSILYCISMCIYIYIYMYVYIYIYIYIYIQRGLEYGGVRALGFHGKLRAQR